MEEYPLARVHIDTLYVSGEITACVFEEPVCDLILGNLPGVTTVHGGKGGSYVPCLDSTRAQTDREKKNPVPLKVADLTLFDLTPEELCELQRKD